MDYTDLGIASMLHLDSLELSGCPTYLASLLESINLPSGRSAKLRRLYIGTCGHQHGELSTRTLERVQCTIMKRIQAYMDDFPPRNIYISEHRVPGSQQTIYMRDTHTWVAPEEGSNSLLLMISLSGALRTLILDLAASSSFCAVQELQTCAGILVEPLMPLYKAFCSVTELSIDSGIHQLLDAVDQYSMFPSLCTLRWNQYGRLEETVFSRLLDFVENRASSGLPLSILYLPESVVYNLSEAHKSRLYGIPGLVVKPPTGPSHPWD